MTNYIKKLLAGVLLAGSVFVTPVLAACPTSLPLEETTKELVEAGATVETASKETAAALDAQQPRPFPDTEMWITKHEGKVVVMLVDDTKTIVCTSPAFPEELFNSFLDLKPASL